MRLRRFLFLSVSMSKNQAAYFIKKGRVSIDGRVETDPNLVVTKDQLVTFDNKPIQISRHQYFLLHKPAGYVCATQDESLPSALSLIEDIDADHYHYFGNTLGPNLSGIVLISDDVRWTKRIATKYAITPKTFMLTLNETLDDLDIGKLKNCLATVATDTPTSITEMAPVNTQCLRVTMTRNDHQTIANALSKIAKTIQHVCLVRLGKIELGDLDSGDFQELESDHSTI